MSSEKDMVDIIPATGLMFMVVEGKTYLVIAHKKDDNYTAISIPLKTVLENLIEEGYITKNKDPFKDKMVV